MGDSAPEDYPRINTSCGGLCGPRPVTLAEVREELQQVEARIEYFEKQATDEADPEKQRKSFTGIVFIVFQNPQDCLKATANNNWFPITKMIARTFFPCCTPDSWKFLLERAPEPSDIYWENMGVSSIQRIFKSMISFVLTALLMVGCVGFIYGIKQWQAAEKIKQQEKALAEEITFADQQL